MSLPLRPLEWLTERASGVLLHPTSLPDAYGIGTLSSRAREWIDFLRDADITFWQVLPLGPTGFGDSPYQSFSAFAGNPYLIDLEPLLESGLLSYEELAPLAELSHECVDFAAIFRRKWPILRLAWQRFKLSQRAYLPNYGLFADFRRTHAAWLEPYCGFMALKDAFGGKFWGDWPAPFRTLPSAMTTPLWQETADQRDAYAFFQYLFFGQWNQIRDYARREGVRIIGDIPIFVALDSADVWANPTLFALTAQGKPAVVAGVPPDYFSETGQLWGNPLYDWQAMQADDFSWWRARMELNFTLFDVVRLDHFRAFFNYWEIPADATDAREGQWRDGPGDAFFDSLHAAMPEAAIIAEDLGDLDEGVRDLRDRWGLPGMAILQFAFDGNGENLYLPHNVAHNAVIYPGTHDNNTTLGWYEDASEELRDQFRRYFRVSGNDVSWDFVRAAYASVARLAIVPIQDLLTLDAHARMNTPGSEQGNWTWRMTHEDLQFIKGSAPYLRDLAWLYNR